MLIVRYLRMSPIFRTFTYNSVKNEFKLQSFLLLQAVSR